MPQEKPLNLAHIAVVTTLIAVLCGLVWGSLHYFGRNIEIEVRWANDPELRHLH